MKLIVKCPHCKQENKAPHRIHNRIDYAKQYGEHFSLKCTACNQTTEFHVDDIKAVDYTVGEILKNRVLIFAILFVVTFVLGFFLGGPVGGMVVSVMVILISMAMVKKNNASKNLTFNKHKLKGRVSGVGFRK